MAGVCTQCSFDFRGLPARLEVDPAKARAELAVTCPLCGFNGVSLALADFGLFVRRSSQTGTQVCRWKVQGRAEPKRVGEASIVDLSPISADQPYRFQLKVASLRAVEPADVCYSMVPVFTREGGALSVPTLPVRDEMFDCVDLDMVRSAAERDRKAMERGEGVAAELGHIDSGAYVCKLPLRGLATPVTIRLPLAARDGQRPAARPDEDAVREVSLRVWPNIDAPEWRHYLVGLSLCGPDALSVASDTCRARLRARTAGGAWLSVDGEQRGGTSWVAALDGRPEWLSIVLENPTRGDGARAAAMSGGVYYVPAPRGAPPGGTLRLAIDFGTSNTCVAWQGADEAKRLVPPADEGKYSLYVLRGGREPVEHGSPDLWPAPKGFGAAGDLFASEILFPRPVHETAARVDRAAEWRAGVEYGVTAPVASGGQLEYAEDQYLLAEFKWRARVEKARPAFGAEEVVRGCQVAYLRAVLAQALVRIVQSGQPMPAKVDLYYSYPLAFAESDLKTLDASVRQACKDLSVATGASWQERPGPDESRAAAKTKEIEGAELAVYVDVGGGSSDILVQAGGGPGGGRSLYVTSMQYAGGVVLSSFAGDGKPQNSCLDRTTSLEAVRRRVREASDVKDVLTSSLFKAAFRSVVENRTHHFYAYLIEYVARLICAAILEKKVAAGDEHLPIAVYFLGNGWGFGAFLPGDNYVNLAKQLANRIGAILKTEEPEAKNVRIGGAPAHELKWKLKAPVLKDLPHRKAAVAFGLLSGGERAGDEAERRAAIVGWTTTAVHSGTGERHRIPWYARYPHEATVRAGAVVVASEPAAQQEDIEFSSDATDTSAAPSPQRPPTRMRVTRDHRLSWADEPPRFVDGVKNLRDLDPGFEESMPRLRRRCADGIGMGADPWFEDIGPYEAMLEEVAAVLIGTAVHAR